MRMRDITEGTVVKLDGGFTCHGGGLARVHEDNNGLYFKCDDGHHYLDGQLPFDPADGDDLSGISKPTLFDRAKTPAICLILILAALASAHWRFGII